MYVNINGMFVHKAGVKWYRAAHPTAYTGSQNIFKRCTSSFTTDGLADDNVRDIYYGAGEYYVATNTGISISTNNGENWSCNTNSPTIPNNQVYCIVLDGTTVFAGTFSGLTAGANRGSSWSNYLAGESVNDLLINNGTVYAATNNGLAVVSTGYLSGWTYYTTNEGLANNTVNCIFLSGTTLYNATEGGLSITNTSFFCEYE
jgi:ligand-binding sensor domain-containing protein